MTDAPASAYRDRFLNLEEATHTAVELQKRLEKFGKSANCPACGNQNMSLAPNLVMSHSGVGPDGKTPWVVPVVFLTCGNCGLQQAHNAIVLGLVPPFSGAEEVSLGD
jgi:transcription elongation factor Elf1